MPVWLTTATPASLATSTKVGRATASRGRGLDFEDAAGAAPGVEDCASSQAAAARAAAQSATIGRGRMIGCYPPASGTVPGRGDVSRSGASRDTATTPVEGCEG